MSARLSSECKSHTAGNKSGQSTKYVLIDLHVLRDYILIVNFILMSLIPFLMLTSLNFSLFRTIHRSGRSCQGQRSGVRQRRDQGIAAMLILVVLVFGLCNVIRIVINVYEVRGRHYNPHGEQHLLQVALVIQGLGDGDWPDWCSQLSHVSNILLVLNSSVNIVIYCWKDPSFRNWIISTKFYRVSFCPLSTFLSFRMSFWDKETTYFKVMDKKY